MGEIRSTLDIIMEKAKNLEVTEEEKAELQRKETVNKAKGMLQKYLDGLLGMEDISSEIQNMSQVAQGWARDALKNECMERIDFEKDNTQILLLLEQVLGLDTRGVRDLIEEFRSDFSREAERIKQQMEEELRNKGIKGTAIVINHKASPDWAPYQERQQNTFKERLKQFL
ncbi:MAG: hypothetical protein JRI39_11325 [Deltaproteobacteria bacterium]|nr:hypothetical protein [Deltaproteobacteria bacterium]MBW2083647.1 hypothetical protein [Deltaproteobacteria bacterium]HDM10566.1 hypothetical protein [Desulfobacteraceae bacterium]